MRSAGIFRRFFLYFLLFLSVTFLGTFSQEVTVRKEATDTNPKLYISSFEGSSGVRERFESTLRRVNWFTLVTSGSDSEYRLSVRHTAGQREVMDLVVQPRDGSSVSLRRVSDPGRTDALVYASVDALIERVFGVPGPCSGSIAFAVSGKGAQKEIYLCNFDGTGGRRLTHNSTISTEPSWGRGGSLLVYTLYQNHATSVILMDMAAERQRLLSRHRGLNSGADLSPDGKWAALCLSRDQRIELYLLNVSSGQLHRLTNDLAVESSPCWSPSGSHLCYVSDRAGNPQLYVIAASGGRPVRLLSERDEAVSPDWSPSSNRVCFSTRLGGQYVIGYVDMSDPSRTREIVTLAAGDWESPSWSPDGRNLVCSRKLNGRRELYLVDTWQHRLLPITQGGDHSLPSWSD